MCAGGFSQSLSVLSLCCAPDTESFLCLGIMAPPNRIMHATILQKNYPGMNGGNCQRAPCVTPCHQNVWEFIGHDRKGQSHGGPTGPESTPALETVSVMYLTKWRLHGSDLSLHILWILMKFPGSRCNQTSVGCRPSAKWGHGVEFICIKDSSADVAQNL